jgi:hypothetical protein
MIGGGVMAKDCAGREIKKGDVVGFFHPSDGILELGIVVKDECAVLLGQECVLIECATRSTPAQKRVWCSTKDVLV